jgi:hypothetical protein
MLNNIKVGEQNICEMRDASNDQSEVLYYNSGTYYKNQPNFTPHVKATSKAVIYEKRE